jgi:hypothetical protein
MSKLPSLFELWAEGVCSDEQMLSSLRRRNHIAHAIALAWLGPRWVHSSKYERTVAHSTAIKGNVKAAWKRYLKRLEDAKAQEPPPPPAVARFPTVIDRRGPK